MKNFKYSEETNQIIEGNERIKESIKNCVKAAVESISSKPKFFYHPTLSFVEFMKRRNSENKL